MPMFSEGETLDDQKEWDDKFLEYFGNEAVSSVTGPRDLDGESPDLNKMYMDVLTRRAVMEVESHNAQIGFMRSSSMLRRAISRSLIGALGLATLWSFRQWFKR